MHPEQTNEKGWILSSVTLPLRSPLFLRGSVTFLMSISAGKVGVSGEVEGMVIQVSKTARTAVLLQLQLREPQTMKTTTTACRLLLLKRS